MSKALRVMGIDNFAVKMRLWLKTSTLKIFLILFLPDFALKHGHFLTF